VPLNYSDDELEDEEEVGMTNEQKLQRRGEKLKSLVATIPADKEGLWTWEIRWDKLSEVRSCRSGHM
jgi:RNA-binding protein 25